MPSKVRLRQINPATGLGLGTRSETRRDFCLRRKGLRKLVPGSVQGCANKAPRCRPRRSPGCLLAAVGPQPSANKEQRPRINESKNFGVCSPGAFAVATGLFSKACGKLQKFPRDFESLRQMRAQRLHSERFRRVMPAEYQVDAEFFRRNCGPMRRLTGNERIDAIVCHPVNLASGAAGNDCNLFGAFRAAVESLNRSFDRASN